MDWLRFYTGLLEDYGQIRSITDTRDYFEAFISAFTGLPADIREAFISKGTHLSLEGGKDKPQYKYVLRKSRGSQVTLNFWAPGGRTRPHNHHGFSAKIHVLSGVLLQEIFAIWQEPFEERLVRNKYFADSVENEFLEEPGIVHQIGNLSYSDWALSIHYFENKEQENELGMEVFDFPLNLHWPVHGEEDTLGPPPKDAEPIWSG